MAGEWGWAEEVTQESRNPVDFKEFPESGGWGGMEQLGIIALLTQGELDASTLTTVWLPGETRDKTRQSEGLRAELK